MEYNLGQRYFTSRDPRKHIFFSHLIAGSVCWKIDVWNSYGCCHFVYQQSISVTSQTGPACVTKVPKYVMSLLLFSSPSPFFSFLCSSVVKTEHRPDITVLVDWGVKHQVTYLLAEPTWLRPEGVQIRSKKSTYADRSKTKRAADGNTYLHIFNDDDKACPLIKVPRRRWRLAFELGTKTKLKHLRIIICTFLTKIKSVIWLRYQDENEACPFDLGTKTKAKPAPWFWY